MLINFLLYFGVAAFALISIAVATAVLLHVFAPRSVQEIGPDPRPPAINLVSPDQLVDADWGPDEAGRLDPRVLTCGHCGHITTAPTTLAAIADDLDHFRTMHALRLAIGQAS